LRDFWGWDGEKKAIARDEKHPQKPLQRASENYGILTEIGVTTPRLDPGAPKNRDGAILT
jgi:hypothetical protein